VTYFTKVRMCFNDICKARCTIYQTGFALRSLQFIRDGAHERISCISGMRLLETG